MTDRKDLGVLVAVYEFDKGPTKVRISHYNNKGKIHVEVSAIGGTPEQEHEAAMAAIEGVEECYGGSKCEILKIDGRRPS